MHGPGEIRLAQLRTLWPYLVQVDRPGIVTRGAQNRTIVVEGGVVNTVMQNQDIFLGLIQERPYCNLEGVVILYLAAMAALAATGSVKWQLLQFISSEAGTTVGREAKTLPEVGFLAVTCIMAKVLRLKASSQAVMGIPSVLQPILWRHRRRRKAEGYYRRQAWPCLLIPYQQAGRGQRAVAYTSRNWSSPGWWC